MQGRITLFLFTYPTWALFSFSSLFTYQVDICVVSVSVGNKHCEPQHHTYPHTYLSSLPRRLGKTV